MLLISGFWTCTVQVCGQGSLCFLAWDSFIKRPRPRGRGAAASCVNCGGDHFAFYLSCPKHPARERERRRCAGSRKLEHSKASLTQKKRENRGNNNNNSNHSRPEAGRTYGSSYPEDLTTRTPLCGGGYMECRWYLGEENFSGRKHVSVLLVSETHLKPVIGFQAVMVFD